METEVAEEVLCKECGGKHAGPCGIEKVIAAVSLSLSQGFEGATRWSISDTTAGLLKLYKRHAFEGAEDTIIGAQVTDRAELGELLEWLRWSIAAYESDRPTLLTAMMDQKLVYQDVAQLVTTSAINEPAYMIAVYHARQCVVMAIRGTYNTTDILTDLNPHTEPFQNGVAHSGMLGAAKWLLEKEGLTLKKLLSDNPGYTLVLTGHSLGGAVAALLAMLIHASAHMSALGIFPTTLGIRPKRIMCWGYGCAACVDQTIAENTGYIHNVVLQDDVVPRVNAASIEALRDEIQETSLSQVLKDGKRKKIIESIERAHVGHALKSATEAGASMLQKIQNARAEKGHTSSSAISDSNSNSTKLAEEGSVVADGSISMDSMDSPETDAGIAAKAVVAVAEGPAGSKEELESRRLYAPGNLYHIRRQELRTEERELGPPVPVRPFMEGEEAPRNAKHKHHVIRGTVPSSRFGRIILSSSMLSDHGCFSIRDGLLDAIEQLG
ncbi:hypothetical protein M758_12G094000 [Ceratodon purpureus]|nr:hypothetical protein M758_12G094000 [Ceratodon purpureus]KAG0598694.1 hypothetical protein M758_12G094000 [Ceratodon purpureus]KAG0598697.1 hypothetical protein M758_12G094000 [Ceratodon purpureus]